MAKRAPQVGDARTTDRTSAGRLGTGFCGKRRRWTAEQKHKIVAEGMEPDASAAIVAGRHGISTGQFYAWRQQLMLRGALDAAADTVPNLAGIDAATSAPHLEPAIPAPPGLSTPTVAAARADCGQADRSGDIVPAGAWTYALRRFRHRNRCDRTRWSPVPGEQLLKLVALGATGDQTFEHVGQIGKRIDAVQLCCADQGQSDSPMLGGAVRAGAIVPGF